jgi:hypothetical protein
MLGDLDRRLNKVLKELDINNLIKMVKSKADIVCLNLNIRMI